MKYWLKSLLPTCPATAIQVTLCSPHRSWAGIPGRRNYFYKWEHLLLFLLLSGLYSSVSLFGAGYSYLSTWSSNWISVWLQQLSDRAVWGLSVIFFPLIVLRTKAISMQHQMPKVCWSLTSPRPAKLPVACHLFQLCDASSSTASVQVQFSQLGSPRQQSTDWKIQLQISPLFLDAI